MRSECKKYLLKIKSVDKFIEKLKKLKDTKINYRKVKKNKMTF